MNNAQLEERRDPVVIGDAVLHLGDCLDVLRTIPDGSVDAVVTDPPAGIGFMGKAWDHHKGGRAQWVAWMTEVAAECLRVLKPGGHALVWALPRTSHWTATALEDAGFEIRDRVAHVFGSGFPKSLDVSKALDQAVGAEREIIGVRHVSRDFRDVGAKSVAAHGIDKLAPGTESRGADVCITAPATDAAKQWQGWGTALKPAMEDWWLCRKPLVGTVVANVQEHGTGALNIDGCRIGDFQNTTPSGVDRRNAKLHELGYLPGTYQMGEKVPTTPPGRWPANLVHDGSPEVVELFPETGPAKSAARGTRHGKVYGNGKGPSGPNSLRGHDDSGGSAARFFYCAKASKADRDEDNKHPTVKPTALMRWLCRLITTPGGVILDPFMGSGSTGKAAMLEGFRFIGVERESEYMDIAAARIASVQRTQDAEPSKTATPVQACFAL